MNISVGCPHFNLNGNPPSSPSLFPTFVKSTPIFNIANISNRRSRQSGEEASFIWGPRSATKKTVHLTYCRIFTNTLQEKVLIIYIFSILRVYKHCIGENIALDYFPPDSVSGQASLNTTAVLHLISIRNIADIILSLYILLHH